MMAQKTSGEPIEIIGANYYRFDNSNNENIKILSGNVRTKQGDVRFFCDSLIQYAKRDFMEMFENVRIEYGDSTTVYAEYVKYYIKTRYANMKDDVRVLRSGSELRTSRADFDSEKDIFHYYDTGSFKKGQRTLTSNKGIYYGKDNYASFNGNVHFVDSITNLRSDSLEYDGEQDRLILIDTAHILYDGYRIVSNVGFLGSKSDSTLLLNRSSVYDSALYATADIIVFRGIDSAAFLKGDALIFDSVNDLKVTADSIFVDSRVRSFKAMRNPVAYVYRSSGDTMLIRADTFYSAMYARDSSAYKAYTPKNIYARDSFEISSQDRYLVGSYHVRFYSDSLQGICDSFYYSTNDSMLRMTGTPVVWIKDYQISGDKIYAHFQKKNVDYMFIPANTFVFYQEYDSLYSQARSKTLTYYVTPDGFDSALLSRNVQMAYFVKDSIDAFISFDRISSDDAIIRMKRKKMERINFIGNYEGMHYPPNEIPAHLLYLERFVDYSNVKPSSRQYILSYYDTMSLYIPLEELPISSEEPVDEVPMLSDTSQNILPVVDYIPYLTPVGEVPMDSVNEPVFTEDFLNDSTKASDPFPDKDSLWLPVPSFSEEEVPR